MAPASGPSTASSAAVPSSSAATLPQGSAGSSSPGTSLTDFFSRLLGKKSGFEENPLFWFLIFFIVFHWALVMLIPVSFYSLVILAVIFFILLPLIVPDGSTWFQKIINPVYATLSIIQIAGIWLAQVGLWKNSSIDIGISFLSFLNPVFNSAPFSIALLLNAWGLFFIFKYGYRDFSPILWFLKGLIIWGIIAWFVFTSFSVITSSGLGNLQGNNYGLLTLTNVWSNIKEFYIGLGVKLSAIPAQAQLSLNRSLAMINGDYYAGTVEQNKDEPLGVSIDNIRGVDPVFTSSKPIVVLADISGRSFQDPITITSTCVAKSSSGKLYPGVIDVGDGVSRTFTIILQDTRTVFCSFPSLEPGSYDIQIAADFPFTTWAYIPYTFVDQETYKGFYFQGKDINKDLAIEENPLAIYTAGPVALGLKGQAQPIPIDRTRANNERTFGATVDNRWVAQGVIEKVDSISLFVPYPINLQNCVPQSDILVVKDNEYTNYTFNSLDAKTLFSSITCRMQINQSLTGALLGPSVKSQKTFAGAVKYHYTLAKTIPIQVR